MSYKFNPFTGNLDYVGSTSNVTEEVLSYPSFSDFPSVGESGKLYIDESANTSYYWKNTQYEPVSQKEVKFYSTISDFPSSGNTEVLYVTRNPFSLYYWNGSGYIPLNVQGVENWTTVMSDSIIPPGNYILTSDLNITLDDNYPDGSIWKLRFDNRYLYLTSLTGSNFVERYSDTIGDNYYISQRGSSLDIVKFNNKLRVFPVRSIQDDSIIYYYPIYSESNPSSNTLFIDFDYSNIKRNSNITNLPNFRGMMFNFYLNVDINHPVFVPNQTFDIYFNSWFFNQHTICNINQQIDPGSQMTIKVDFILKHERYMILDLYKITTCEHSSNFGEYFNKRRFKNTFGLYDYIDAHSGLFKSTFFDLFSHFEFQVSGRTIPASNINVSLVMCNFNFLD